MRTCAHARGRLSRHGRAQPVCRGAGFDWVSVSEHHYSPRILTPSLPIAATYIASHVHDIKIALLGPIVPQSNPVLLAEEMAMPRAG
jgi:alkanesulfonate monooxygenase SsuD/methylene tetrahydromethanopterin reductase-like flavin-dependent oxidoreductase (luciferase family)